VIKMQELLKKIEDKTAKIAIIGLGYVGLPLAMMFARRYDVVGYDEDKKRTDQLRTGKSYITDVKNEQLQKYLGKNFRPITNPELDDCDFILICVPTPLDKEKEPDLQYVIDASEVIAKGLRKDQFIILESTTYPGTTDEIVVPILEKSGLKAGIDFGVAYSPERVDPGNKKYGIANMPKIVGGINEECTNIAAKLYGSVIKAEIVKVKDCKVAEAAKIMENIFREVNIALVNEMSLIFERMGIDIWEVIKASSTKPFGFMPYYPGPGVGGHCIPLDPFYLSYKAKQYGFVPRFIEQAKEINEFMRFHTVNLITQALKKAGKKVRESTIAVMGIAYKKDIKDTRESPAKKIIEEIMTAGGKVKIYDPHAEFIETKYGKFLSEKNVKDAVDGTDCAVFITDHTVFKDVDLNELIKYMKEPIIIDCRNVFDGKDMSDCIYYGIGKPNKLIG